MKIGIGTFLRDGFTRATVESAFRRLDAAVSAGWETQHNADGTHGNVTFKLGSATGWDAGAGVWMAPSSERGLLETGGSYDLRVGDPAANYLAWDGFNNTLVVTGTITASAGAIGGWTIGASSLTGGNATLASSGNLTLGTSNDVVRLSADDATYRLWIGHATAASAPFRVGKSGSLYLGSAVSTTNFVSWDGTTLTVQSDTARFGKNGTANGVLGLWSASSSVLGADPSPSANILMSSNVLTIENNYGTGLTEITNGLKCGGSIQVGGTAARATTAGTSRVDIFDGTAPVGTLANGISLYSTAGELRVMDSGGVATLLSPHDDDNYWVFDSIDTRTGATLHIDVEKILRFVNQHFGLDCIHGYMVKKKEQ